MEELNKELEKLGKQLEEKQAEYNSLIETKASAEDMQEVKSEMTKLNEAMTKQGETLTNIKEAEIKKSNSGKDAVTLLMDAYKSHPDQISRLKKSDKSARFNIDFDRTKVDVASTDFVDNDYWGMRVAGINELPYRRQFLAPLFRQGSYGDNMGNTLIYAEQSAVSRLAENIAECGPYPKNSDIDWITRRIPIEKIGDCIKVCLEALDDFDFVESQIRNLLLTSVQQQVDEQILLGTGVTPELIGISSFATAFAAGSFALQIPSANIFDLVHVTQTLINKAGESKYSANVILMNPCDVTILMSTKDSQGNYVIPPFATENGRLINGVRIVESTLIPENEAYVMDTMMGEVMNRKSLSLSVADQNEDDWTKDLIAFKASQRLAFYVAQVDYPAFVHIADIAAAITAINKP